MKRNIAQYITGLPGRELLAGMALTILAATAQAVVFNEPGTPEEGGWHKARHHGWYLDYGNGWIFHTEHGFLYEIPYAPESSFVWAPRSGWWWVGEKTYPYIYSLRQQGWLYYQGVDGRRTFWHIVWSEWMSGDQEENISALLELLRALRAESEITPELVANLREALANLCANSTPPSQESLDNLAATTAEAWADGVLSELEKAQIAAAFLAVLDSADFPEEDVANVRLAWLAVVEASNVDPEDVTAVKDLIKAIIEEWKAGRVHPAADVTGQG